MELTTNFKDVSEVGRLLKLFAGTDWPRLNGRALNRTAFGAMQESRKQVRKRFILRNRFTERSITFQKVRGFDPRTQQSVVGSSMEGLRLQEFSGHKTTKGGGPVAIPEPDARISRSKLKLVKRAKYLSQLKLVKGTGKKKFRSKSAKLVAGMIIAKQRKIALKLRDNIYEVKSLSFRGKGKNKKVRAKLRRLYHVGKKRIFIPKKPWLNPALDIMLKKIGRIYISEAEKVLKTRFQFLR